MKVKLAAKPTIDSIVDGIGLRTVFWFQGCNHHCKNCHNPDTWDFDKGFIVDTDELVQFYRRQSLQAGITISGGDPFYQPNALLDLLIKLQDVNIWIYTGFTYEYIFDHFNQYLQYIDVLVDGLYIDKLRDLSLYFKGSSNQRVIDVQATLKNSSIIEINFED